MIKKSGVRAIGLMIAALVLASLMAGVNSAPVAEASNVSQGNFSFPITYSDHYDRNPTVLKAKDGTYWMFFARSVSPCARNAGCDADNTQYNIFYMNSKDSRTWTSPRQLTDRATMNLSPADFRGRTIAATQDSNGKIWVFWANGGSYGPVYYFTGDAKGWSAPVKMEDQPYFNVEAVATKGKVWMFYEDANGAGVFVRSFDLKTAAWTAPTQVAEAGMTIPKVLVDGDTFRVAMVNGGSVYTTSAPISTLNWSSPALVVAAQGNVTNWDPTIMKDERGRYNIFYAPDQGDGSQRIEWKQSANPKADWSKLPAKQLTDGVSGAEKWWDYWPEAVGYGNDIYLFYTSEKNFSQQGIVQGPGHIYLMKLDARF